MHPQSLTCNLKIKIMVLQGQYLSPGLDFQVPSHEVWWLENNPFLLDNSSGSMLHFGGVNIFPKWWWKLWFTLVESVKKSTLQKKGACSPLFKATCDHNKKGTVDVPQVQFFGLCMDWWHLLPLGCFWQLGSMVNGSVGDVTPIWLVVAIHFKNISQIGSFPQVRVKIKNVWVATT